MKILTIVIPTRNRSSFLSNNLKELTKDIEVKKILEIKILIVDNASEDNTSEVAQTYASKYDYIEYVKNTDNIGPINNFLKSIALVDTEYLHLLADDDVLDTKYFDYFPEILKHSSYGVIYINSYGYNINYKKEMPINFSKGVKRLKTFDDLVLTCMQNTTFISVFILNSELTKKKINFKKYTEINYSQIVYYVAKNIQISFQENIYIKDYLVAAKRDNANVDIFQKLFLEDFIEVIEEMRGELTERQIDYFKDKYLIGYLPMYIYKERIRFPQKAEEMIKRINIITENRKMIRFLLINIVRINIKYAKYYVFALSIVGKIYLNGFLDTFAKLISLAKSKLIIK